MNSKKDSDAIQVEHLRNIRGHDTLLRGFQHAIRQGRFSQTYLFAGPEDVGKRTVACGLGRAVL